MTGARRPLAIGAVGVVHAALLVFILTDRTRAAPARPAGAIIVRDVPSPAPPPIVAPTLPPIAVDIAPPVVEIATSPGASDDCPLIAAITVALAHDNAVGAAVAAQPETALMAWDGGWSSDPAPALAPIRRVVTENIQAASSTCRNAAMTGPRLVIIPNGTASLAVAIGSGTWRWSELLSR